MSLLTELRPGAPISVSYLDVSHHNQTIQLIYVGLIDKDYLILRFPNKKTLVNSQMGVAPGAHLTLRAMIGKETLHILNFKASSLGISKLREPVLLVQFPKKISSQQIRTQPRLSVEAMASLKLVEDNLDYLVMISDFSLAGLKCEFKLVERSGFDYDRNSIDRLLNRKVVINFGVNDDFESDFQLHGIIKNARLQDKVTFGIKFDDSETETVKTVFAILLMRLHGL